MNGRPLVSIISPVYNCAPFVADTIRSVLSQTLPDWEMILVDDCSVDDSVEIVQGFAEQDNRVKLIRLNDKSGPAVARNTAIEAANGRYIAFLDSDDQWLPEKLQKQTAFMRSNAYGLTYTQYERITETGERTNQLVTPPEKLSYADMLKSNQIGCLTAVYDTRRFGKVYMPLIQKRQDYALWLKLLKKESFAWCLPEPLALYRIRTDSVSRKKIKMVGYNWHLYREVEKLSLAQSAYYLGWNVFRKIAR